MRPLILASTSVYRRQLLERLDLPFEQAAPELDETPLPDETPTALVGRLARAKAHALAERFADAVIIGSDQVAVCNGQVLGKPGTAANARQQLHQLSGNTVDFLTGLCVLDAELGLDELIVEPFRVHFRALADAQIEDYVARENPVNCAGSFKSEGLGIALFEGLEGNDPNALIGLPLIRLTDMLSRVGIPVLGGTAKAR